MYTSGVEVVNTSVFLNSRCFSACVHVSKSSFPGIASFGSFEFEASGIRARKFDKIGKGVFIEEKKIAKNEYSYRLGKQGGFLSKSKGFWKKFHSEEDKEVEIDEHQQENSTAPQKEGIFSCPDHLCTAKFLKIEGLTKHQFRGIHRRRKNSESTIDTGVRLFADAIQTDAAAALSVKSDSLVSIVSYKHSLPELGWAMKKADKPPPMSQEMKKVITQYFHERRNEGRRALAREIAISVREMKKANGHYLFDLKDCPKESQCQNLISTLLRGEPSTKKANRKRVRESEDGEEISDDDSFAEAKSKRGKGSVKSGKGESSVKAKRQSMGPSSKKILLTKEKMMICEDDEYAEMMEDIEEYADEFFF